jgi:hypothetical protein
VADTVVLRTAAKNMNLKVSRIRRCPGYKELAKHRKIDACKVITCKNLPTDRVYAGDFSRSTIEFRIEAGYKDALNANIGDASASTSSTDV